MSTAVLARESRRPIPRTLAPVMRTLTGLWGPPDHHQGDFVTWLWGPGNQANLDLAEKRLTVVTDGERDRIALAPADASVEETEMAVAA